ncbi:hypothetical protein VitviT2T_010131 [Vitis vinifera]|uniref:K+ potassium transporter integral membrane domain-containing protein n=1 Tax=Vitis vinifera TaxID=29760 RepID=A0ABY9C6V4_VITVI|nr:hypothetical protein VitviT2T_010131 [Vitis vinifera]
MSVPKEDMISEQRIYELLSLMFWIITTISLLKYAFMVLRVDDSGEGGRFDLYSLLCQHAKVGLHSNDRSANEIMKSISALPSKTKVESRARRAIEKHKSCYHLMLFLALFGSCMMYLMNLRDCYNHEVDDALIISAWLYVALTKPIPISCTAHPSHSCLCSNASSIPSSISKTQEICKPSLVTYTTLLAATHPFINSSLTNSHYQSSNSHPTKPTPHYFSSSVHYTHLQ